MSEGKKPEDLASLHRRFDELEHVVAQRVAEACAAVFRTPERTVGAGHSGLAISRHLTAAAVRCG